jgi:hypothetical protein
MKKTLLLSAMMILSTTSIASANQYNNHESDFMISKDTVKEDSNEKLSNTILDKDSNNIQMDNLWLPTDFKVYVDPQTGSVINHSQEGFEERTLITFNDYKGKDGGYIAIYTREKSEGIYSVGGDIYVAGMVRIKGQYIQNIFYPEGYNEGDDITQDKKILEICNQYFLNLKDKMWIGGDTGGWFGF